MPGDPLQRDGTGGKRKQFLLDLPERLKQKEGRRRGQSVIQIGEEKWQTCWCCRDQQRACTMAQALTEKLEHTRPAEKKRVASVPQLESCWQVRQSRLSRARDRKEGIQCQRGKENSNRGKRKIQVFLCRRTVRVKVQGKVIPASFLKIGKEDVFWGERPEREGRFVESVGDQNPGHEGPPRSKIRRERK